MQFESTTIGSLQCHTYRPREKPELVVVLCHGYGAPGTDLVPLAPEFSGVRPELLDHVQFVFPEAPHPLPDLPGGRAWWPINIFQLQMAIAEGKFRDLQSAVPPQLPEARAALVETLQALRQETGLAWSRFVLGGFSQGAMLTTDVMLHLPESPAALVVYSGTLINEAEWRELSPQRAGLAVLQTHGTRDPILPFDAATALKDLFVASGMIVDFHSFPGIHTIPALAIPKSANLLAQVMEVRR